jgi:hypothetical protein
MVEPTEEKGLKGMGLSMLNWSQKKIKDVSEDSVRKALNYTKRIDMNDWLKTVSNCPYKYAYDDTGIAIDAANRSVILIQHINKLPITKTYSFNNIRNWSYEIPGIDAVKTFGPVDASAAMGVFAHNWAAQKHAHSNTGLFIRVKDIDYPEWFIKFEATTNVKKDLLRWMEIFNQSINDKKPDTSSQKEKFCPMCGVKVPSTQNFVQNAEEKLVPNNILVFWQKLSPFLNIFIH